MTQLFQHEKYSTITIGVDLDVGEASAAASSLFAAHQVQGIRKLHSTLITEVALKYSGCAISEEEITQLAALGKGR